MLHKIMRKWQILPNGRITSNYTEIWKKNHNIKKIPNGYDIHHIDGNPLNNYIGNLCCLRRKRHLQLHKRNKPSWNKNKGGYHVKMNPENLHGAISRKKLTDFQVEIIKYLIHNTKIPLIKIGKLFGVKYKMIGRIKHNKGLTYTDIKIPKKLNEEHLKYLKENNIDIQKEEKNSLCKITTKEIKTIKYLLKHTTISHQKIADIFNISTSSVGNIEANATKKAKKTRCPDKLDKDTIEWLNSNFVISIKMP